MKEKKVLWGLVALGFAWSGSGGGQAGQSPAVPSRSRRSALESWWNGKYASGNWFGVRDTLEDHGLKLGVEWKANFLWNVDGGLQRDSGTTMNGNSAARWTLRRPPDGRRSRG